MEEVEENKVTGYNIIGSLEVPECHIWALNRICSILTKVRLYSFGGLMHDGHLAFMHECNLGSCVRHVNENEHTIAYKIILVCTPIFYSIKFES